MTRTLTSGHLIISLILPSTVDYVLPLQPLLFLLWKIAAHYSLCGSVAKMPGWCDRLVGLVVRRPPPERKIQGSNPACAGIFSEPNHTSDLKIGTPVATLTGAWRYRVSVGTGRPGVSVL